MSNVLGELIDFMDAGYRGFGLYGGNPDGSCGCGYPECKAAYKHPRHSNWQVTPEWSDEQLEGLEMIGHYDTGYGVLVKGLLVVDVDARNGGVESFAKLCRDIDMDLTHNCGLVVQTGSGKGSMHLYYKAPELAALIQSHKDYPGIDFKSSGFCVGPGSLHASGNRYVATVGSPKEIGPAPDALVKLLVRPDAYRADHEGMPVDVTDADLRDMLSYIDCDCERATWISIGMALHHTTGGAGFELWDSWSSKGAKYPGAGNLRNQWDRFGKASNPVTIGSIFYHAQAGGWVQEEEAMPEFAPGTWFAELAGISAKVPVEEFVQEVVTKDKEKTEIKSSRPCSVDGIDLKRPPGFVGELTKWVNSQSIFPRENLAVAAAIQAVGNIAGLRYTDDIHGVTTNLFTMCVADSATGKDAILGAVNTILREANLGRASVGHIKSEQEIIRNLLDNQAAFYVIDEIGIILKTITQSKESYHSGVVGALMNAYSKASSFMPLSGDVKRDARKEMSNQLAAARKRKDENDGDLVQLERRISNLERALASIDNGLEKPFLSLIGFTTPITFDSLVTFEQATNGFIGRTIIVQDRDSNPRPKDNYKRPPMTDRMSMTLKGMYDGGYYDPDCHRVEHYGERAQVPTTAGARELLKGVSEWAWNLAAKHQATTGLESIPRRAHEMVSKISLILAVPGNLRTEEHVRWAFAFVERDIRMKCSMANSNLMEELMAHSKEEDAALRAMSVKITSRLVDGEWETLGTLRNKVARGKESLFAIALDGLKSKGKVEQETYKAPHNGKEIVRVRSLATES